MKQIITITTVALLLVSCGGKETRDAVQKKVDKLSIQISKLEEKKQTLAAQLDTNVVEKVYPVKTMALKNQTIDRTIEYSANLLPWEEVFLAPSSPGRVEKINVEVGDRVRKGDLLAKMDETQLTQAKLQLAQIETDFARLKALRETNSISQQQFDQLKTQLDVTQNNINFLEENTKIIAPFDGVITGKYFENGELYSGAPNNQAGKAAILAIQQIDQLKATVNVSETYYPELKNGTEVEILSDIYKGEVFNGRVDRIYPTIDPSSRSFKVEIKVGNAGQKLRPGMYTRVCLKLGEKTTIVVPAITVLQQEGTNIRYVFVNNNGIAKRVNVEIGTRIDDNIEVISNELSEGSELIIAGQSVLMDGNKIKTVL